MSFSDDFTGTNGQALSARSGWTLASGSERLVVSGDQLKTHPTTGGLAQYFATNQGSANMYVQARFLQLAGGLSTERLILRAQDASHYIAFRTVGTGASGWQLTKYVAGSPTVLVSFQGAAGALIRIEAQGDTLRIFQGGVQQGSDVTESVFNTETDGGFISSTVLDALVWDDFEIGALGMHPAILRRRLGG